MAGGMHGKGGLDGRGHAWQGEYMAGSMCSRGIHGGGACVEGGFMHGRGHVWKRAYVAGWYARQGVRTRGRHPWQERCPLLRTVHILLECILVSRAVVNSSAL